MIGFHPWISMKRPKTITQNSQYFFWHSIIINSTFEGLFLEFLPIHSLFQTHLLYNYEVLSLSSTIFVIYAFTDVCWYGQIAQNRTFGIRVPHRGQAAYTSLRTNNKKLKSTIRLAVARPLGSSTPAPPAPAHTTSYHRSYRSIFRYESSRRQPQWTSYPQEGRNPKRHRFEIFVLILISILKN